MKKLSVLGICLFAGLTAVAQNSLVKEVEREMKSSVEKYPEKLDKLKPAFTNEETAGQPYVWFVAGKGGMDFYDNQEVMKKMGKGVDDKVIGNVLMNSFDYLLKALPLDSIPNEKGKIKPKYSKDMVNVLAGHYLDYNNAAIDFWGAQDFKGAYDAWTILLSMPKNHAIAKAIPSERQFADSTLSEIAFNRGLAAWQIEKLDDALAAFDQAKSMGYNKKQLYDYAIAVASQANKNDVVAAWANEAIPLYGKEDDSYIRQIINSQLQNGEFDKAKASIDAAIAEDPTNSQYQWVLGIIYNYRKDELRREVANAQGVTDEDPRVKEINQLHADSRAAFQKAVELNPANAEAYSGLGMIIYEDAQIADAAAPVNAPQSYYDQNVTPLLKKAAECYEKAVEINPEDANSLKALRIIYYNMNDEANMNRVEQAIKLL